MTGSHPRRAALIVNGKSRKGRSLFKDACRLLADTDIEVVSAHAPEPDRMDEMVCRAVADGVPLVIIGGGDGSISSSIDHLVGKDTVFALLPLGTANSFARTLGIPVDVAGAIEVIAKGRVAEIDLGMIDGDYYANCAAIGISPLIADSVPHGLKKWLGRPGYLSWAAVQMARFKPFVLHVTADGVDERVEALEVRIANGAFHGGTELVETDPRSGEIVVQAVVGTRRTKLLWSWGLSLLGPDKARGTVREWRGRDFRVATDPPLPISIDGEVLAQTPVRARLARRAVRMIVPA